MKSNLRIIAIVFALLLAGGPAHSGRTADMVVVEKSESRLYLMRDGEAFASFHVAFGANPEGHKQQQGDERTPEGKYLPDDKNAHSLYYKSIHMEHVPFAWCHDRVSGGSTAPI